MAGTKNFRKSKYVNSMLQGNLMLRMVMYWAIYNVALIAAMIGGNVMKVIPEVLDGSRAYSASQFWSEFTDQQGPMLMAIFVLCPLLIWDMLRYSHRIAGPIHRFRKALADHVAGQPLQTVKLRNGDMLLEFQDTWNEFVRYKQMQDEQKAVSPVQAAETIANQRQAAEQRPTPQLQGSSV